MFIDLSETGEDSQAPVCRNRQSTLFDLQASSSSLAFGFRITLSHQIRENRVHNRSDTEMR